ncbi:MAG: hypothetical protein P1S59_14265 [bacterium]|nr:hypothetical protein [bacterium]
MISDNINNFIGAFHFSDNKIKDIINKSEENIPILNKSQIEIMKLIHQQFQIPAIKKLYHNLEWKDRVFWVVHGNIYNQYDDLCSTELKEYIIEYIKSVGW